MKPWTPESWRGFPAAQQPYYSDMGHLNRTLETIKQYPPLVFSGEIEQLKRQLRRVGRGEAFLLQGGDCAESFQDCNAAAITRKIKILLQMSLILCYGSRKPVLRIGRIAGQYAKPRSQDFEVVGGAKIPVFRGENINSVEATLEAREADPERLLKSYHVSAHTLNYIRALTRGGFADLHFPDLWDVNLMLKKGQRERYQEIVRNIRDAIAFVESITANEDSLNWVDFYTSHEGLHLPFEEAVTRYVDDLGGYYNLGAHMLWIGDRTRQLDGAHIEYFRGIKNPIGIKVGPNSTPAGLIQLVTTLNPEESEGRIVLITRFGATKVSALGDYIDAVKAQGVKVVWSVDPMHGNGSVTAEGIKTRNFDDILSELTTTAAIHKKKGTHLGGVHFELTGDDVTECLGGPKGIAVKDLSLNYASACDPRLNYSQSLEMAFLLSSMMQNQP